MAQQRERLPNRRIGETFELEVAGLRYIATVSRFPDGRLGEIFLSNHKSNSAARLSRLRYHASISASLDRQDRRDPWWRREQRRSARASPRPSGGWRRASLAWGALGRKDCAGHF